ncbi:MAG: amidohydrolase [Chloroflexi bacterium]|nr:amidohydrolase [Chloroflexota bacterium]
MQANRDTANWADLVLLNANVIALDAAHPRANAVVVSGGRIAWVGDSDRLPSSVRVSANIIDCGGQTLIPGFIDAHCHLLAYAASLLAVDCSSASTSEIDDILSQIRRRADSTPRGEWIRGTGYSEFDLREKRHPTRWELDRAAPFNPVRLNHRSGHACVLNSIALERVGIDIATEEPPGGTMARDLISAEPNGLLLDMDEWLDVRIPPMSEGELRDGMAQANRQFLSQGITSIADATVSNSPDRWKLLRRLKCDGLITPSLTVMPGAANLDEFADEGLHFGYGDSVATIGHAKIILTSSTSGRLHPSPDELRHRIDLAHRHCSPVAIHAIEKEAVLAASTALMASRIPGLRDRIEHASECPPEAMDALLRAKPVVVSQPSFVRDSGARYLSEFGEDARWLYRFRMLAESGIVLAASSDAPVSVPSPLMSMHAAITRETDSGAELNVGESVTVAQALEMHTNKAAYAIYREDEVGTIAPGKRADLVLLDADPTRIASERLLDVRATMTIIGGELVWQA